MLKLIVAASLSSFFFGLFGVSWEEVDQKIATEFPAVKFISSEELLQDLNSGAGLLPLLIDVREPAEFAVSHLRNSVNMTLSGSIATVVEDKATPIVVYCSVGYRSAGVAAELQQMGYTNVLNLHHSLFEWANKGYPMVNARGSTALVHPFSRAWAELVARPLRSYQP